MTKPVVSGEGALIAKWRKHAANLRESQSVAPNAYADALEDCANTLEAARPALPAPEHPRTLDESLRFAPPLPSGNMVDSDGRDWDATSFGASLPAEPGICTCAAAKHERLSKYCPTCGLPVAAAEHAPPDVESLAVLLCTTLGDSVEHSSGIEEPCVACSKRAERLYPKWRAALSGDQGAKP